MYQMFGGSAYLFAIIKYFSFAFFLFTRFATQLLSTPVASSNLRNLLTLQIGTHQDQAQGMVWFILFHMTQSTSRSIIKAIACSKPAISEHQSKWKHNGTIVDQCCKQRGALCHIGLAKDRGGHLVNQPPLSFFDKC